MTIKEKILNSVNEYDIFKKYIGFDFKLGKVMSSPLREGDLHPSFNVYKSSNGHLYYKDFAGDRGDCFDFVMKLHDINFQTACELICNDFLIVNNGFKNSRPEIKIKPKTLVEPAIEKEIDIRFVSKQFENIAEHSDDPAFTDAYLYLTVDKGINPSSLKEYNACFIDYFSINNKVFFSKSKDFAIGYIRKSGKIKICRPKAERQNKWRNNIKSKEDQIFGFENLKSKYQNKSSDKHIVVCVICAGETDTMLFNSLFQNLNPFITVETHGCISAYIVCPICFSSETKNVDFELMYMITQYSDIQFILYDRDETGIKNQNKITDMYKHIIPFDVSLDGCKDLCDCLNNSKLKSKSLIKRNLLYPRFYPIIEREIIKKYERK